MKHRSGDMPFTDHLEELRRRLLAAIAFLAACWLPAFLLTDRLLPWLLAPLGPAAADLVYLRPAEKFMAYLNLGFDLALLATIPFLLIQLARFVWPALEKPVRRVVVPFLLVDILLLAAGLTFAWLVMIPFATGFFLDFGHQDGVRALWSLGEYLGLVCSLSLATAVVSQMPVVLLFVFRTGLVRVRTVARYRRHAIILIFIIAAIITPPDIISQCLTALPLVLLFELTLLVGRLIEKSAIPAGF